ncbi:hypothetical protein GDO78_004452 [Eleutherodactylus coqui]|uniref:Uncharacterized protein n=1 Tax=Eleutherodactylus coqui TaxID=57060 RepID=A0A8J6JZU3_ELECQ|nr:hypothetical protein GDO78_004452 [Eleutherodactylus coqui]
MNCNDKMDNFIVHCLRYGSPSSKFHVFYYGRTAVEKSHLTKQGAFFRPAFLYAKLKFGIVWATVPTFKGLLRYLRMQLWLGIWPNLIHPSLNSPY